MIKTDSKQEDMTLRINHYTEYSKVLGPGNRFVIWLQGCNRKCYHCINPEGQRKDGGILISISELEDMIIKQENIQGITISGGEPFLQFKALRQLVERIVTGTNLDIMLYSGFKLENLYEEFGHEEMESFLKYIDIFVDGEYIEELDNGSMYRGSDNQNIYMFTTKYKQYYDTICHAKNRDIEFEMTDGGNIYMTGIPPKGFYDKFMDKVKQASERKLK